MAFNNIILYINTISHDQIIIALRSGAQVISEKKIIAPRHQAEKLVPAISKLLEDQKVKLNKLKKIVVANQGGSFTSLRIGVITANALAYALNIPVETEVKNFQKNKKFAKYNIIEPQYDSEATIGSPKKFKL